MILLFLLFSFGMFVFRYQCERTINGGPETDAGLVGHIYLNKVAEFPFGTNLAFSCVLVSMIKC